MGLMQGMLVGADGVHVASLQPDLESGVCTAQLARWFQPRSRTERHVTQPSSFSNSEMSTVVIA